MRLLHVIALLMLPSTRAQEATDGEALDSDPPVPSAVVFPANRSPADRSNDDVKPVAGVIDRIVVVVGDRLVTESDIALERELAARDPSPTAVLQARRADPLEFLIDAAIIRGLAGDVAVYQPSWSDVQTRLERLRESWPVPGDYEAFLQAHGLDEDRMAGTLYSRLVVERYVQRNIGLAAEAAGDTPEGYATRYAGWIAGQRDAVLVRAVPAHAPDPGDLP